MALGLSSEHDDTKGKADALNNLGVANHIRGSYESALGYYRSCMELRRQLADSAGVAGLVNNMASIYALQGNYPEALENYQQSLELKLKLGNKKGAATSYNNIGNIYYYQKNYQLALDYYQKALEIDSQLKNNMGQARSLGNIGLVYLETGKPMAALDNYRLAYQKMDSLQLECQKMYSANGLGQAYFKLNDIESAHRYLDEAYTEASVCNDPVIISSSLETLGKISIANRQNTLAEQRLLESYRVARVNNLKAQVKDASQTLYEFYKGSGRVSAALNFLEINKAVTDSILNQDLTEQLTRRQMAYEFRQEKDSLQFARERDLLSYNSDIQRRKVVQVTTSVVLALVCILLFIIYRFYRLKNEANRQLAEKNMIVSKALKEKEVLLREIHHRVKNNLQIVSSLLSIQSKLVKDETARQVIRDTQSRVYSMALVHQNLQTGGEIAEIAADKYLGQLIVAVKQAFDPTGQCQINLYLEPIKIYTDIAISMGLIVNELVTNIFKHAFPAGITKYSNIDVKLEREGNSLRLSVSDNGVGIAGDKKSFGMQLIDALAKSMEAEITSANGHGTSFTLNIPHNHGQFVNS